MRLCEASRLASGVISGRGSATQHTAAPMVRCTARAVVITDRWTSAQPHNMNAMNDLHRHVPGPICENRYLGTHSTGHGSRICDGHRTPYATLLASFFLSRSLVPIRLHHANGLPNMLMLISERCMALGYLEMMTNLIFSLAGSVLESEVLTTK